MKRTLLTLAFATALCGTQAQTVLNEDFENFDFSGWETVYPEGYNQNPETGVTFGWQTALYDKDTQLTKATNVGPNKNGGTTALKSFTGRYGSTTNLTNDNWLISPEITVDADHCYLTFDFGANDQININSKTTSDENRMKLQVLVSEEGTEIASFKDQKALIIPMGVQKWSTYCIDLSQYIGKTIHIAFRDFGSSVAGSVRDSKFIDNLRLCSTPSSDYAITATSSITGGAVYEQPYTITVANYGVAKGSFTANYKLGDKVVSEEVTSDIANGESIDYTFKENLKFTPGESTNFSAWVTGADDAFTDNDTTAETSIAAAAQQNIPYSSTDESLQEEFTGATTSSSYATFIYDANKAKGWLFTQKSSSKFGYAYLYTNKAFTLPAGDVRLDLTGTVIGTDIKYEVYIAKYGATKMAEYATKVGTTATLAATAEDATTSINLTIPEAGDYIIGIRPMASTQNDQVAIHGFSLKDMSGGDVALTAINNPTTAVLAGEQAISVEVKNNASLSAKNVTVAYQINSEEPVKETIAAIEGNGNATYEFATKAAMSSVGIYHIKAWIEKEGDTDITNDTASVQTYAYEAKSFPYSTSFETQTDSLEWQDINVGSSNSYWAAAENIYAIDGSRVMYIDKNVAAKHDNFVVSPAINVEAGQKGRISFYYIGTDSSNGTLLVYLVNSLDKASLLSAKYIGYASVGPTYGYFSAPVSVKEAGKYYIAIRQTDSGHDMWIDDLHFDNAPEILVVAAETSVKGTTDSDTETALSVQLRNAGAQDITGAQVSYTVNGGEAVTETVNTTISANSNYVYTFNQKIALKGGQDTIRVSVNYDGDTDLKNNAVTILGPTKINVLNAPFTFGFEDTGLNSLCEIGNNWQIGTKTPSDGKQSLLHQYNASSNGDWSYLPAMKLYKGSYDISFFWKTYTSTTHSAPQNFGVYVGKNQKAADMTIVVKELTDATNATSKATKEMATIDIPEDGIYYIGIKCTTATDAALTSQSLNQLVLDEFEVNANPVEGIVIADNDTLNPNLQDTEAWHRYYTNSTAAIQWKNVTGSATSIYTTRNLNSATGLWSTPGILRSQPIAVKVGETYSLNLNYSIDKVGATALDGNSTLAMYAAKRDMPDEYTTLVLNGKEGATEATGTFTAEEDGVVYFGVICNSTVTAKFTLNSIAIAHATTKSSADVNGDGSVDISDVNAVISVICGGEENSNANVNKDDTVDISDVNAVISVICGN